MSQRREELTPEELEQDGEELPERRAMSFVDLGPDVPIFPVESDPYELEKEE